MGRPTKYKPEYCDMLIKHMAEGYSFESFAGTIDCGRETIYGWERLHEEFSDAKKVGFARNQLFWEKKGHEGLWSDKSASFNSTVWIFNMKNRHGWRDKTKEEAEDEKPMAPQVVIKMPDNGRGKPMVATI